MKYRQLGNTDLEVSEIGFGAWGIGGNTKGASAYGPTDDKVSELALLKAYDQGITFYDTAALYGYGHSEELIGSALKNVRENIVLATKVGYVDFSGKKDFSTKNIRHSLESSLKRLQTDYIDVFQLHDLPIELILQEDSIFSTLESLKKEGKIRIVGISVNSPHEGLAAIEAYGFKTIQVNFNLVDQRASEIGLFEKCNQKGVGIISRTPLCFGFLTGKYNADDNYEATDHRSKWTFKQIDTWANAYKLFISDLTESEKQTNAQIALRFCLSFSHISTVIPGMLTSQHVEENSSSSDLGPFSSLIIEKFSQIYSKHQFFIER